MNEKSVFSYTGQGFTLLSHLEGVLEVRPTRKGDEYWIDDRYLGSVLDAFDGKHIVIIIQEVSEAITSNE